LKLYYFHSSGFTLQFQQVNKVMLGATKAAAAEEEETGETRVEWVTREVAEADGTREAEAAAEAIMEVAAKEVSAFISWTSSQLFKKQNINEMIC
jgi:aminopeptidase N